MRAADLLTAAILFALGVLVVFDALRLGIGWGTDGPRSGFFPFWLGVVLLASCALVALQAVRRADPRPFLTRVTLRPVLHMLAPAVAAVVVMQVLGLYVASALYLAFYMRWIGRHSWVQVVALSVAFPLVTFVVFERWFLVPMPKGPLEALLGF